MNFYEEMIKRYDRRIKRIEENPDPKLLRSTKLFYELERESCIDRLQAWKEGKPFYDATVIRAVMAAMGLNYTDSARASMRRTAESRMLFDTLRTAGLPDDGCDITTIPLAMYIKGELPIPAFTIVCGSTCDPIMLAINALARMFNIPSFCLDTKVVATYDAIRYGADQLGELIEFAESKVPGVRYDEAKLIELQDIDRQGLEFMRDIYQARKRVPCAIAGRDSFRILTVPSRHTNPHKALEWYRAYRDELLERADKGIGVVGEEKLRFMWAVTAPYYANPFEYLEKSGVTIPLYVAEGVSRQLIPNRGTYGDEKEFGRKLTPLEEAIRMTYNSWGSLGRAWVDDIIYMCKDLRIDGIVYFRQVGCPTTLGLSRSVADAVEKELGILTLDVEGRNIDADSYNQAQFETKLGEFIDLCLAKKGIA